jgi:hypothetical protein
MELKSNTYITFNIHSNKDLKLNSLFQLKFTVNAYGYEELRNIIQINDLIDSLTCLFGKHLSRCYLERFKIINFEKKSKHKLERNNSKSESENTPMLNSASILLNESKTNPFFAYQQPSVLVSNLSSNTLLTDTKHKFYNNYNSEFYRILLRGGLDTSISTKNENDLLFGFLNNLNNFYRLIQDEQRVNQAEMHLKFFKIYDKNFESIQVALVNGKNKVGGLVISELVLKIFSCLIWHTPSIRYEHLINDSKNDLIAQAFKAAESTRLFIIEQQQLMKANLKDNSPSNIKTLIEITNEKLDYLLKLRRLPEQLLNYEQIYFNYAANLDTFESCNISDLTDHYTFNSQCKINKRNKINVSQANKPKNKNKMSSSIPLLNRLPKFDSLPTLNLIYEFIFDQQINNLENIQTILNYKLENAILISDNFDLATQFLENILAKNQIEINSDKFLNILEYLLTFLSNFFDKTSIDQSGSKLGKFPPTLQFNSNHFLQNLYGCGLEQEKNVRNSYFKFLSLILSIDDTNKLIIDSNQSNSLLERLKLRLDCFTISLLNIDWDLFDLKFLENFKIISYLLRSSFYSMPIRHFKCEKNQTNSEILEEVFKLSKETFNLNNNLTPKIDIARGISHISESSKINEEDNLTTTNKEIVDEDSFDMKIFPKLYQNLFQNSAGSAKPFDTESLLKCLSTEIKTFEHYEKFIVARYMFWKYFSKLRANFYCDECEVMLTENRYVCLECREHCLCFNCFSKSIIDNTDSESNGNNKFNSKKLNNNFYSTVHKSSHRMLLLDHLCDKCGSLIIGKRIHCEECDDYDLCLMCYKRFETINMNSIDEPKNNHTKEHKITIIQPIIIVAKPDYILDIQVYLYLNSQMLFSIFTIKLSTLMANINLFYNDQSVNYY